MLYQVEPQQQPLLLTAPKLLTELPRPTTGRTAAQWEVEAPRLTRSVVPPRLLDWSPRVKEKNGQKTIKTKQKKRAEPQPPNFFTPQIDP